MKTFILACLCFNLLDIRLIDGFSMMGRCSSTNLPMPSPLALVKHLLAEARWAVAPGSWHGRNLCASIGLRALHCPVMLPAAPSATSLEKGN